MSAGRRWVWVPVLALVVVGWGCGSSRPSSDNAATSPFTAARASANGARTSPAPEAALCVPASLEERAARVLLVGLPDVTSTEDPLLAELGDLGVGGVLLTHGNVQTTRQLQALVSGLRAGSRGPLVVAADEEPGRVRTFEELLGFIPSARRLASERGPDDVRGLGYSTGQFMSEMGFTMNMAPVADVDGGPWDSIIGDRSFSEDPDRAGTYALAYARGLQDAGITPVVKHFPGHGRTATDDHYDLPEVDAPLETLLDTDVRPFKQAIAAGAPVIMVGNVAYDALKPDIPATLTSTSYTLLRELGFKGVAITDSIGMGAVNGTWDYGAATIIAVASGADGVLATDGWNARWMRDELVLAVHDGRLPETRLNEAAARMMALAGGDPQALTCKGADLPSLR